MGRWPCTLDQTNAATYRFGSCGTALAIMLCLAVGFLLAPGAGAQQNKSATKALERAAAQLSASGETVGLVVGVIDQGAVTLKHSSGVRRAGSRQAVDGRTVFRLASLSKAFSASLAALMVEDGAISWNAKVRDAVPAFRLKRPRREPTLEHILSHRVGLPPNAYDNYLEEGWAVEKILPRFVRVDPVCAVGDCYAYQNISFSLVGPVLERASGRQFETLLDQKLFSPLGLHRTSLGLDELKRAKNWAEPHSRRRGSSRWRTGKPNDTYYRVAAAGGVNASLEDMLIWLRAQMGYSPDVLSADVLAAVQTPRVTSPGERFEGKWRRARLDGADYGMGWRIYNYKGHEIIFHGGGVSGYKAQIAFSPELNLGFVAMSNSSSPRFWGLLPTFFDAAFNFRTRDWMELGASPGKRARTAQ